MSSCSGCGEELGEEGPQAAIAKAKYPAIWMAVTAAAALCAYITLEPRSCQAVRSCVEADAELPNILNAQATCGLVTVFLHEVASLCLNYRSARPLMGLIAGIENIFIPPLLLCIMFAVLVVENSVFMSGQSATFSHAAGRGGWQEAGKPVYTVIYLEWLINVPLLIILAGKCALGRPLRDITTALLATNVYIIIAWSAHFVANPQIRWALIIASFVMYGWASYDMTLWVIQYFRTAVKGAPSRILRPCLTLGLIFIFGVYGLVYLCAALGMITNYAERVSYICMNIGVKLIMSMAFAGIRSSEYHDMLVDMLINTRIPFQRQIACGVPGSDAQAQQMQVHQVKFADIKEALADSQRARLVEPLLKAS